MRRILLSAALTLALAGLCAPAQELPDIGSSAGELLTPKQQEEYGAMMLAQLRHYDYLLEDPLLDGWLDAMGSRLAANSDRPKQPFTFFLLKERQINAFATLGGYIGVNSGLVLAADREDEVAGVLSHEIAHVTQQHVLRGVERAQRDQLPILLAMLGAIAAAQASGGNSSDDAAQAAMVGAMGLMQQRQIDYTRSNESEADRLGIQTLSRAGYDPVAMADFFAVLQARSRSNAANYWGESPDWLMTHPVTTLRITEAKQRAEQIRRAAQGAAEVCVRDPQGPVECRREQPPQPPSFADEGAINPLLPKGISVAAAAAAPKGGTGRFDFARERLRVLSADTPQEAVREYERLARAGALDEAQRYGLALARLRANQAAAAAQSLAELLQRRPGDLWLGLAVAEAEARTGKADAADARFEALLRQNPGNRAVALTYASVLNERATPEAGRRAQAILRPLLGRSGQDATFQKLFARACEIAGDPIRAGEAYAEAAYLNGRPEQALVQLNTLKRRPDLDYYARARIEARIAAITPTVLELKRQGIRDEDLGRR
ncbi:M48 family metalloprotease [Vulcaniibacterium tengchongense]|uniref:Putative beta-barrel assembly-enhancing protease n=1 Tax=Vulcaniibacterium tengchongense TaxID=1273429 RepID=A0A3N4W527_9GAMM|nr:M48 family metalloprotease [Vulcaniibacterium tengchongense]RPE81190.1 putative Zn-dependent protease [Vulcaniibacterium tengchongense]